MRGDMEPRLQRLVRTVLLLHICWLWRGQCLTVRFTNQQALYVIKGQDLILQAQIELLDSEHVVNVTWDHVAKTSGTSSTLAEFPHKVSDGRVTLEQQGATLKIRDYQAADAGVYTVTVTDQSGQRQSAQRTVQEYLAVHHVSVMVNVSHSVLHCMEAWGTEPTFTWLQEKVVVTEKVGRVSADGTSLYVSGAFCGHFTCIVSNKLGHSSATYTAEACESPNRSTTAVVVFLLLILTLVAACLAFILWRKHGRRFNRRERLRETYEEPL
ncbi:uncharacterized protein si:dkeyp-97a10.2 isoform X1 [Onychostoma macrolepis]|uniref:Immunoglobulin V-set domain-containing protein n=2 Tax=Onychostoma macrolepis TaxID=369639 RepID=A0A7J6C6V0_9TELE|nr:uncharacterized protein si:dkeyp-97a10.2 isoform X1 [Onychostoma macrolepis]KAF4102744.1 hypothetical protein G5714_015627 [Onychostoma macrolepis]